MDTHNHYVTLSHMIPDDDIQDELRGSLDVQARLLYGLIHARWIVTARGLAKMVRVYIHRSRTPSTESHSQYSSRNTSGQILVDAHASCVNPNHCFQSVSQTCPMKNPSNFTVVAARTSTHPSHLDTALSTGHTLALPFRTSYSLSTLI